MMASGCLVLPRSRGRLKKSFWRCNFAQPTQRGRTEGSGTLQHAWRRMCPDPELLSHLDTPHRTHAPIHTTPKCLIQPFSQQTASNELLALCKPLWHPCALGNPPTFPCKHQVHMGFGAPGGITAPCAGAVCNNEPFWIVASKLEKFIRACAHREQAQKPAEVAVKKKYLVITSSQRSSAR